MTISLILGSFSVAFATEVNQETLYPLLKTNTTYYAYRYNGGSTSIARNTGIADEIGYFLQNLTETNYHLYSVLDGVEGYIDGIEGSLTNINNKLPASTWYSNITGYLDGVEGYIDGLEGSLRNIESNTDGLESYVDGVESKLDNINSSIQSNNNSTSIGNIETYAHNIQYMLDGSSSGIYTLVDSLGDTLTYINSSIGTGGAGYSVLDKLSGVLSNQNNINNNLSYWNGVNNTSVAESAYNIADNTSVLPLTNEIITTISAINTGIHVDTTDLVDISTEIHNDTTGIHNDTTGIHDDTTELIDKIESFNIDYNNIDWIENKSNFLGVKTDINGEFIDSGRVSGGNPLYFYYNLPNINDFVYKLRMPFALYGAVDYNTIDFDIFVYVNGRKYDLNNGIIAYQSHRNYTDVYLNYPLEYQSVNNVNVIFGVVSNSTLIIMNTSNGSLFSLPDNKDGIEISKYNILFNIFELFKQAKEMYFDDEALQAKRNNAGQTTAVLTGFTGSGQASATANDYGTLSNGVSNVKGGMTTNVNASSAFGIFNNQSGYSFWSAETLQELNSSGTNTRNFSRSNDYDGYVYYNGRLEYLLNEMNGGEKK